MWDILPMIYRSRRDRFYLISHIQQVVHVHPYLHTLPSRSIHGENDHPVLDPNPTSFFPTARGHMNPPIARPSKTVDP